MNESSDASRNPGAGISAMAVDIPQLRVSLEQWCSWTGNSWPKVAAVVGRSFRMCGPHQNAYTMAANATLDLIRGHGIDPRQVGFLGLGTESSTDNAAGAVIVKGMVDDALTKLGLPRLARDCEVPEFKQACLGGIYALKNAVRYLSCDGRNRVAIVISTDIAEYQRGSTGEPTQGAGAVAMLVEPRARLLAVDLERAGNASDYRGFDFRKPFARHQMAGYASNTSRMHDFPVFNGKYSTTCYVDEVVHALTSFYDRNGIDDPAAFYDGLAAIFMHRPYHRMPLQAIAVGLLWSLGRSDAGQVELRRLCEAAGVSFDTVLDQIRHSPRLFQRALEEGPDIELAAEADLVVKPLRESERFKRFVADKMTLGADRVMDLGNLYTASLPAWLAAGIEHAVETGVGLDGKTVLAIGYGSGDAAEAIPMTVVPGWQQAATRIGLRDKLATAIDLDREQYEALHDGRRPPGLEIPRQGFHITRVGERNDSTFQDIGLEYYGFSP